MEEMRETPGTTIRGKSLLIHGGRSGTSYHEEDTTIAQYIEEKGLTVHKGGGNDLSWFSIA